ncbi:hypothetical protein L2E65_21705 [Planktothrix agardhii 1801]|jgi:hypothetical protein|uniref:hypothetical protein n=1 Tax=Planktothrix agardhii TaxID=1160 RepID=UPI001F27EF79|nr:hypothetical protein [Planktothrix agardhii]MCF3627380.1 hypothetical protein [Planktothrix agardhii 1801]
MNNGKSRNSKIFRQIILSFLTGSVIIVFLLLIQAIVHEQELSAKTLFEMIGGALAVSLPIVAFINLYIKQEIDKEKVKLLEENVKSSKNQLALNDSGDALETATNLLNKMAQLPNLSTSEKEDITSLINKLEALKTTAKSYEVVKDWLEKPDQIRKLSKDSGNLVLNNHPFNRFEIIFLKQSKYRLYQSIYDCLTWIQASFNAGDYLTTNNLPKISDKKRTIKALNWIKTEVLPVEIPESSVKELEIYFDKLILLIPLLL